MSAKQFNEKFTARVSGESPRAASPWHRANCFREARTIYLASQTRATTGAMTTDVSPPVAASRFKSRCARRDLCPRGTSYRPNGPTWLRGQPRAFAPPILLFTRRTAHLTPDWLAAALLGRRLAHVTGRAAIPCLKASPPIRVPAANAGGEGSGSGTYGASR